jgi:hypothetical protein
MFNLGKTTTFISQKVCHSLSAGTRFSVTSELLDIVHQIDTKILCLRFDSYAIFEPFSEFSSDNQRETFDLLYDFYVRFFFGVGKASCYIEKAVV